MNISRQCDGNSFVDEDPQDDLKEYYKSTAASDPQEDLKKDYKSTAAPEKPEVTRGIKPVDHATTKPQGLMRAASCRLFVACRTRCRVNTPNWDTDDGPRGGGTW